MSISFEDATIPGTVPDDWTSTDGAAESTDLACEVCGRPLAYSGRGRKPKRCDEHKRGTASTGVGRRSTKDVESAIAVMDGMYELLYFGLGMFSENAMALWQERREPLLARDRKLFEADPALCRKVNSFGSKGGTGAFIGAHAMALFPVAVALNAEINVRAENRRRVRQAQAAERAANAGESGGEAFGPGADYMP